MVKVTFTHHGEKKVVHVNATEIEITTTMKIYRKDRDGALDLLARDFLSIHYSGAKITKIEEEEE